MIITGKTKRFDLCDKLRSAYEDEYGLIYFVGNRVSAKCPLTKDERQVYVYGGRVRAIERIMQNRGIPFAKAIELLDEARK